MRSIEHFPKIFSCLLLFQLLHLPQLVAAGGQGLFLFVNLVLLFFLGFPVWIVESYWQLDLTKKPWEHWEKSDFNKNFHLPPKLWWLLSQGVPLALVTMGFFLLVMVGGLGLLEVTTILSQSYEPLQSLFSSVTGKETLLQSENTLVAQGVFLFIVSLFFPLTLRRAHRPFSSIILHSLDLLFFIIFVGIFLRLVSFGKPFQNMSLVFYPKFSEFSAQSFLQALVHSFLSFSILGSIFKVRRRKTNISLVSKGLGLAFLCFLLGLMACLLSLPMLGATDEGVFGMEWLFFVLPRWFYYSGLGDLQIFGFYVALFYWTLRATSQLLRVLSRELHLSNPRRKLLSKVVAVGQIIILALIFSTLASINWLISLALLALYIVSKGWIYRLWRTKNLNVWAPNKNQDQIIYNEMLSLALKWTVPGAFVIGLMGYIAKAIAHFY